MTKYLDEKELFSPSSNYLDEDELFGVDKSRTIGGTAKDIGVSAAKGVVGLGEAAVGLGNIATGGLVGKGLDKIGYDPNATRQLFDKGYSPAQQEANRIVDEAEGFWGKGKAMVQNPSTIGHALVETAPLMFGGGAIGGTALKGAARFAPNVLKKVSKPTAGALAGAFGEGAITTGSTSEQIRSELPDRELTPKAIIASLGAGAGTSIFGAVGGRLAQRLGFADPDTMLATASLSAPVKNGGIKEVGKRIIGGGITEGIFEELPQSVQETIWQNAALDKPLLEDVPEAAAESILVGGAMGSGANLLPRRQQAEQPLDTDGRTTFPGTAAPVVDDPVMSDIDRAFSRLPDKPKQTMGEVPGWTDQQTNQQETPQAKQPKISKREENALNAIRNPKYTTKPKKNEIHLYNSLVKKGLARNDGGTYSITKQGREVLSGKQPEARQEIVIPDTSESVANDLMYDFVDTAQAVQDQDDARTRKQQFNKLREDTAQQESDRPDQQSDVIYQQAVDLVRQSGNASTSMIQRSLKVDMEQAGRLVEQMERDGIVGPANGAKPREVIGAEPQRQEATNDTLRPDSNQLAGVEEAPGAPVGQEADTGEQAVRGRNVTAKSEFANRVDGYEMYSVNLYDNGKLIGQASYSLAPDGTAKIGKISAFGGENSIGVEGIRRIQKDIKQQNPAIKKFVGDRVSGASVKNASNQPTPKPADTVPLKHRQYGKEVSGQYVSGAEWAIKKISDKGFDAGSRLGFDNTDIARAQYYINVAQTKLSEHGIKNNKRQNAFWSGALDKANEKYKSLVDEKKAEVADTGERQEPVTTEGGRTPKGATGEPEITGKSDVPSVQAETEPSTKAAPATPPPNEEGAIEAGARSQRSESAQDDVMEALEDGATENLYVAHNLSEENLLHVLEIGGLPVPSLAVASADGTPFTSFGEITLLADPSLLESSGASVFDADVYSPRTPSVSNVIDREEYERLVEWMRDDRNGLRPIDQDSLERAGNYTELLYNDAFRFAWLRDQGKAPRLLKTRDFNIRAAIRKKFRSAKMESQIKEFARKKFNELVSDRRIFKGYTHSGKRRYIPYNMDNIVKEMTKSIRGGEGFNYGAGSVRAAFAKKFRNIKEIQRSRDRVISSEKFKAIKEESQNKLADLLDFLAPYYRYDAKSFGYMDDASSAIAEGPRGLREAFDLDQEARTKINEFVDYLKNLPTEYFEAKVRRAVSLDEFHTAIVPSGTSKDVIDSIKRAGLKVKTYKKGDSNARLDAVKKTATMFSLDNAPASGKQSTTTLGELLTIAKRDKGMTGKLAQLLSDIIPGSKLDVTVEINPRAGAPSYNPRTNVITVRDPEQYGTAVHEIVHAVTAREMERNPAIKGRVRRLMNQVAKSKEVRAIVSPAMLQQIKQAKTSQNFKAMYPDLATNQVAYAFLNEREFLAQAFSDKQFQGILKNVKIERGNVLVRSWDAFIDTIMKGLGINATHRDAFGEAISIVAELAQMEAKGRGRSIMEAAAWHGSPHRFDKFDISKIGTGEGAQAYGFGLYFTSKEEIARHYRDTLSKHGTLVLSKTGETIYTPDMPEGARKVAAELLVNYPDPVDARFALGNLMSSLFPEGVTKDDIRKEINTLAAQGARPTGSIYRVELAPKEDEYLLWDRPLSEQSEKVKAALESMLDDKQFIESLRQDRGTRPDFIQAVRGISDDEFFKKYKDMGYTVENGVLFNRKGDPLPESAIKQQRFLDESSIVYRDAGHMYRDIAHMIGSDVAASEYLHSLGIRGIKYLDGSSRGKGEGDYNYVIFDDADVEITDIMEAPNEAAQPPEKSRGGIIKKTLSDIFDSSYMKKRLADIKFIEKIFSSPDWTFRKSQAAWRLLNAQYDRMEAKHMLEKDLLRTFVETFSDAKKKFKKDYAAAKEYLLEKDRNGKTFGVKRFAGFKVYDPDGNFVGDAENDIAALKLIDESHNVHKKADPKTDWNKGDYTREEGIWFSVVNEKGRVVQEYTDEQEAVVDMMNREGRKMKTDGFSEKAIELVREYREMTNRAFDRMVADLRKVQQEIKESKIKEEPTVSVVNETKRWGVYEGNKLIASFSTKEDAQQAGGRKHKIKRHRDDEIKHEISLSDAISQISDLRGSYFARQRPRGAVIVRAEKGTDKVLLKTDMLMVGDQYVDLETGAEIKRPDGKPLFNWLLGQVPGTIARQMRQLKAQGYEISVEKDTAMPESVFDVAKLSASIASILDEAQKTAGGDKVAVGEISKIITANVADIFKARGYLSSRLKRQDDYWRGFEEDPLLSGTQYARGMAAGIAKKEAAMKMLNIITGRDMTYAEWKEENPDGGNDEYQEFVEKRKINPKEQPEMYREAMSFTRDMLRNQERIDRTLGTLQGLAVIKFLGFRVSSAAVNATNMVQAVPATISARTGASLTQALRAVTNGATQYGKLLAKKDIRDEDRAIFQEIIDRGWDQAQYNKEAAEVLMSRFGRTFDTLSEWSMKMFGAVEKTNRAVTIFAAYKELRRNQNLNNNTPNDTTLDNDLLIKARAISNDAHGVYGAATRPSWTRGAWNPLKLPFTFVKFSQNYIMNMTKMGLDGHHKQAAYMLLSPGILAGAGATLATPVISAFASVLGIGGDDPEEEFYQWVEDNFGSDRFARHGIAGLAGVNLKGSLQINSPMPTRMSELFGAPQAIVMDTVKGIEHYRKGELLKGTEAIMPTAVGSAVKALRESREGISTGNYSPVYYGDEPVKADGLDATLRFFSFNPARISGIREKQWSERKVEQEYTKRRTEIYSKLKRFYIYKSGDIAEIMKEVYRYNDMVQASGRIGIPPITPSSIRNNLRRAMRPSKKERQRG